MTINISTLPQVWINFSMKGMIGTLLHFLTQCEVWNLFTFWRKKLPHQSTQDMRKLCMNNCCNFYFIIFYFKDSLKFCHANLPFQKFTILLFFWISSNYTWTIVFPDIFYSYERISNNWKPVWVQTKLDLFSENSLWISI